MGPGAGPVVHSLSLVKALLLVAQLRAARDRPLSAGERRDLLPMIRESSNAAASRVVARLGRERIERTARGAGCLGSASPTAGASPRRRRGTRRASSCASTPRCRRPTVPTGCACCSTVVPAQRWGIGQVVPAGWTAFFKGGWTDGPGLSEHQVALLTRGDERVAVAVMSTGQPGHAYARRGLRGVFARLLATAR